MWRPNRAGSYFVMRTHTGSVRKEIIVKGDKTLTTNSQVCGPVTNDHRISLFPKLYSKDKLKTNKQEITRSHSIGRDSLKIGTTGKETRELGAQIMDFSLQIVGDIFGQFFDNSVVELLNVFQLTHVFISDEIDSHTFATKTTRSTDTMNIIFTI